MDISTEEPTYNIESLETMKNKIENMDKYHQIEILKILTKNKCKINENKSGVFVNLSFLQENAIAEIVNYIEYIGQQEKTIKQMECQKQEFENSFFVEKEDKDNVLLYHNQ
jgi:hypothetical protein